MPQEERSSLEYIITSSKISVYIMQSDVVYRAEPH